MKPKVAIVSLKFNAGLVAMLQALADGFRAISCDLEFVLHPDYKSFPELRASTGVHEYDKSFRPIGFTHALFFNVAVPNRELARHFKARGAKVLYAYHEPVSSFRGYIRDEGIDQTARVFAAHYLSAQLLRLTDTVVLPSRFAEDVYLKRDSKFQKLVSTAVLPLCFRDDSSTAKRVPRRYVSYIGNICLAHGFDDFTAFMFESLRSGSDLEFAIVSKAKLPDRVANDPLVKQNPHKIFIQCGRVLQSAEINHHYASSVCVWNAYRRSTQSAVLANAFMFGTPVIATRVGAFPEFIQDGVNGRLVSSADHAELSEAISDLRTRFDSYSRAARKTFLQTFHFEAQLPLLRSLL